MITTRRFYHHSLLVLAIMTMSLFAACTSNVFEYNGTVDAYKRKVTLHGSIVSRSGATSRASTYKDTQIDNELIQSWWIVFVNRSNNKIAAIKQRETGKSTYVRDEQFLLNLNAGQYDVYSFANISKSEVEALSNVGTIELDGDFPAALSNGNAAYDITKLIPNGTKEGEKLIPMTGHKTISVSSTDEVEEEFEVIRMVAKIELLFKNASQKDIKVLYAKIYPLNVGNISVIPDYSTLTYGSETDPKLMSSGVTATDSSNPTQITFATDDGSGTNIYPSLAAVSSTSASFTSRFYVRESLASSHPVGQFLVNVGIERDGKTEEILYALSGEDFSGINRNDWVQIPITFTDYVVSLNVNFYPPIGGYPATITENKGEEFYCTFSTQGEFEIYPTVIYAKDGTQVHYPNWDYSTTTLTVGGDKNIFKVEPTINTDTGEITGTLGTDTGTAYVDVIVKVETSAGVWQDAVYKRRVYIIRA